MAAQKSNPNRRMSRIYLVKRPAATPPPAPESDRMQRARRLPWLGPGLMVTVPLDILIEYMQLHGLEPAGVPAPSRPGELPPPILIVKREKRGGQP